MPKTIFTNFINLKYESTEDTSKQYLFVVNNLNLTRNNLVNTICVPYNSKPKELILSISKYIEIEYIKNYCDLVIPLSTINQAKNMEKDDYLAYFTYLFSINSEYNIKMLPKNEFLDFLTLTNKIL
jgi:hypothetical protein